MNLYRITPSLTLLAISAALSAQEIAKGVTLDGYVDSIFTGTGNSTSTSNGNNSPSTADFSATMVANVGWVINDRARAVFILKSINDTDGVANISLNEAYGTIIVAPGLEIGSGKGAGPFGYYAAYATGLNTITSSLTQANLYTVNPLGVWGTYTKDQWAITAIVADGFTSTPSNQSISSHSYGIAGAANKASKPGTLSPGLDVVFNATPEWGLNIEGYVDPSAGNVDNSDPTDEKTGSIYYGAVNAQYKNGKILTACEVLYKLSQYGGKTPSEDVMDIGWSAFATYTLPADVMSGEVTAQLSQFLKGEAGGANTDYTITKAQLALLTNPVATPQFSLNYEGFYINDKSGDSAIKTIDAYGVAVEGLYVIP